MTYRLPNQIPHAGTVCVQVVRVFVSTNNNTFLYKKMQ